jgi:hypothetical protein
MSSLLTRFLPGRPGTALTCGILAVETVISPDTTLIISQDYELFFHRSGTIDKCLFEPCDALLRSARKIGYRITFYVDAGMLCRMRSFAPRHKHLSTEFDRIRTHLTSIVHAGHDIGLHIHPHWEDTQLVQGDWEFANTRYQLRDFSRGEAADIVTRYAETLREICGMNPASYRAGGFCIEPFDVVGPWLKKAGIDVDSSVVPGAYLQDRDKGFDFRTAPAEDWWYFDRSPAIASQQGDFLEIPITSQKLPFSYYWRRMARRLGNTSAAHTFGNGSPRRIGRREVLRRLAGLSRTAEVSVDDPKASELERLAGRLPARRICHIMGHPKNLSLKSLLFLENMLLSRKVGRFESVAGAAKLIRAGELS